MLLPKVYISVLNWNGYEQTIRCLQSLERLDYTNYQVIVVDNNSQDDSVERIRAAFPDIRLVCSGTNLGYAGGNELALKETLADSHADLFWILNNDAVVKPNTLTALVEAYQEHGEALYGSIPLTRENESGEWYVHLQYWEIIEHRGYSHRKIDHQPVEQLFVSTDKRAVGNVSGVSILIPLITIQKHGFIDTSFFMYMEDADYCFRLREVGIKSFLVPGSVIYHIGGGSRRDNASIKSLILYYQVRNRLVFRRRHIGNRVYIAALLKQCFYVIGWVLLFLAGNKHGIRRAYYTLLGIWDASRNRMGKIFAPEALFEKAQQ